MFTRLLLDDHADANKDSKFSKKIYDYWFGYNAMKSVIESVDEVEPRKWIWNLSQVAILN